MHAKSRVWRIPTLPSPRTRYVPYQRISTTPDEPVAVPSSSQDSAAPAEQEAAPKNPAGESRLLYGHNVTAAELLRAALLDRNDGASAATVTAPPGSVAAMVRELMVVSDEPPYARLLELLVRRDLRECDGNKVMLTEEPIDEGVDEQESRASLPDTRMDLPDSRMDAPPERSRPPSTPVEEETKTTDEVETYRLHQIFEDATSMDEVVRIVAWVMETGYGMEDIHELEHYLMISFQRLRRLTDSHSFLISLNAIIGILRRNSLPIGHKLCVLGLRLSAQLGYMHALRRYMIDCRNQDLDIPAVVLIPLMRDLYRRPSLEHSRIQDGMRFGAWQRRDALRLLTGWRTVGTGIEGEEREISLRDWVSLDDIGLVKRYLECLGQLGACSSIQQLWLDVYRYYLERYRPNSSQEALTPPEQYNPQSPSSSAITVLRTLLPVFVRHLVQAGDSHTALDLVLHNHQALYVNSIHTDHFVLHEDYHRYHQLKEGEEKEGRKVKRTHDEPTTLDLPLWRDLTRVSLARFGHPSAQKISVLIAQVFPDHPFREFIHSALDPFPLSSSSSSSSSSSVSSSYMDIAISNLERCLGLQWVSEPGQTPYHRRRR